ncbi:capsule biosynthesis protein [Helicobacter valdiviensis]|uniref:Capsule biosynthesis protein n=1 Tax=Helicobacter valdiviensis TaxID=1458358 RepID=A0A2W6MXY2_9HELI|nr:capsule biosynthesis protein [Helicobacter valdiviensis]PZT48899.1 capsule biosynthesis protein [Helicobacter valdiviensis]
MNKLKALFKKTKLQAGTLTTHKEDTLLQAKGIIPFVKSFKIVFVLMIPVICYYLFFAAPRYVSTITMSVRSSSSDIAPISGLASLVGVNTGAREDVLFLQSYIHSLDMLNILQDSIDIKSLYQKQGLDPFYSLKEESSQEDFLKFFQNRTKIIFDQTSGLLSVEVEGFTQEDAQKIANTILMQSEKFVNEISHKAAREQMAFAEQELLRAKERLSKAQNDLLVFQGRYGVFDPLKQAEAKASLTNEIESKIAQKEAELTTMQSYLNENAPQIIMLKSEIKALNQQLDKESAKIVSSKNSKRLNNLAAKFQDLSIEAKFAQDAYTTALTSVETTRIESSRKIKQLVIIQGANLPQDSTYPRILYNILTIFVILSLLYGIIKLIAMIIEEHRY